MKDKTIIKKYFDAWREVRKDCRLSRGDLAIMDTIQDQAYSDVWFSYQTFADRTGLKRRNTIYCFDRLEELGYITRMRTKGGSKRDTNHYVLREDLRSPFKSEPELELLEARRAQAVIQSDVETSSASQCTIPVQRSAPDSAPDCTLMNKGTDTLNESNMRPAPASQARDTDSLTRPGTTTEAGLSTKVEHLNKGEELIVNREFNPFTDYKLTPEERQYFVDVYGKGNAIKAANAVVKRINNEKESFSTRAKYIERIEDLACKFRDTEEMLKSVSQ